MFIRPPENRAIQISHVGETGRAQARGEFVGAIQFPQVQWITTRELADWLEDRHRPRPVLLDVRTVEEWSVSCLPGARRVDPRVPRLVLLRVKPRDKADESRHQNARALRSAHLAAEADE